MEIRNALQKIENYLTVVSNLNKTILSEGTMSRDELLLMKKYLYTSIDRVEDIERLLVIDRKDEKSFTPTETVIENYAPPKAKEIVEVVETTHIEEVEAQLSSAEKEEVEEMVEEIHAELEKEEAVIVGEIEPLKKEEENILEVPVAAEEVEAEKTEVALPVAEEKHEEEKTLSTIEITPVIQNIITEDFAVDELKELPVEEKKTEEVRPLLVAETKLEEIIDTPFINKSVTQVESIAAKFGENKPTTFAEQIASSKKEEQTLFEQLNQKLNTSPQPQLFEMFDDHKEDLHETFMNSETTYEPLKTNFDDVSHGYSNESVLVAEKVETKVEELTPSSLNDVFKPQVTTDTALPKIHKTFSESIALNDKFIFVRELFGNQFAEYEHGLKQLDQQASFAAAEMYCKENLWNKFSWNGKTAAVERFMELLGKRFN